MFHSDIAIFATGVSCQNLPSPSAYSLQIQCSSILRHRWEVFSLRSGLLLTIWDREERLPTVTEHTEITVRAMSVACIQYTVFIISGSQQQVGNDRGRKGEHLHTHNYYQTFVVFYCIGKRLDYYASIPSSFFLAHIHKVTRTCPI